MFNLNQAVRKVAPVAQLETVELTALINHIKADKMQLVENKEGKEFIHIMNSKTQDYFTIGVSAKAEGTPGDIRSLLDNNVIYCGVGDNGAWFSLSRVATSKAPAQVITDIAGFLAKKPATSSVG